MFQSLSTRLSDVFGKLRGRGVLSENDVNEAMREVRIALLEADVALPVAKDFIAGVKEKAVGAEVIRSVSPAQMVIKIVHDRLVELLGAEQSELNVNVTPPAVVVMAGLQGSGKTTTTAKIALQLKDKQKKKTLMASLDIYRPAAQEQLKVLGEQTGVDTLPIVAGEKPEAITKRALEAARLGGYDVLMLDTAGRLHVDSELMDELARVSTLARPVETLLVVDALTGQDAVNVAQQFSDKISLTGVVLTRVDGDGRGGAALSMRAVTGCPIKYIGVGEKLSALEVFHPERIASRILDMGDVVSLVERAAESIDRQEAEDMAKKLQQGQFDLDDLWAQLKNMKKMGGLANMMGMLPGIGKIKQQLGDRQIDESILARQEAMLSSMTRKERKNPDIIKGSRKRRIAEGSGTSIPELNRLLKQHKQMSTMMKKLKKLGPKGMARMMQGMTGN